MSAPWWSIVMSAPWWPFVGQLGLALIGGVSGGLFVDLWWQPRQARRRAAALLRAEIAANRQTMLENLPKPRPEIAVIRRFLLPHVAWDAVAGDVGALDAALVERIVNLYHLYANLTAAYEQHAAAYEAHRATPVPSKQGAENYHLATECLSVLMAKALDASDELIRALAAHAGAGDNTGITTTGGVSPSR